MRTERAQRREQTGNVKMALAQGDSSGRKVVEAKDVSFAYGERTLMRDLSTTIFRGDRIGLIGPNGSGKTTLIKLLLGELKPDSGEVRLGSNLQVAYFDQYRATLREDWNALENVAEGREFVDVGGKSKHVIGYLQDFLFTPERARAPITRLSGGERNRLLLARLFAQPSNLLVMDEPTNDLDVETLELLEELLADYPGTLLLVSHDRDFLDNVVTSTLVMEGEGRVGEYVGGYSDWLRQRPAVLRPSPGGEAASGVARPVAQHRPSASSATRMRANWSSCPGRIEALETKLAELTEAMNDPGLLSARQRRHQRAQRSHGQHAGRTGYGVTRVGPNSTRRAQSDAQLAQGSRAADRTCVPPACAR
jgi:ATP-binding cassette subfamily F protein uup